jgi:hypothetical protein
MLAILLAFAMGRAPQSLQVVGEETFRQLNGNYLAYTVTLKAILPDGSHALLSCVTDCEEVQSLPPEKRPPADQACEDSTGTSMGYVHTCKYANVGTFEFKRSGDRITVFHRSGKTSFQVTSSW